MSNFDETLELAVKPNASVEDVFAALDALERMVQEEERARKTRYEGIVGFFLWLIDMLLGLFGYSRFQRAADSVEALKTRFREPYDEPEDTDLRTDTREERQMINARITEFLLKRGDRSTMPEAVDYLVDFDLFTGSDRVAGYLAQQVLRIDDISILERLFSALADPEKARPTARNLNLFHLPEPPVHQAITVPALLVSMDLSFSSLREEIELVRDRSNGLVQVQEDVWDEIERTEQVVRRGEVDYRDWTLELIIRAELNHFGLEHFVEGGTVTICTLDTAAQRWQDWWHRNRNRLTFSEDERKWVLD